MLGILIDRLRAMREPHPMDVRVWLPQMVHQHAQVLVVKLTPRQLKASSILEWSIARPLSFHSPVSSSWKERRVDTCSLRPLISSIVLDDS